METQRVSEKRTKQYTYLPLLKITQIIIYLWALDVIGQIACCMQKSNSPIKQQYKCITGAKIKTTGHPKLKDKMVVLDWGASQFHL